MDKGKLRFREKLESYDNVVIPWLIDLFSVVNNCGLINVACDFFVKSFSTPPFKNSIHRENISLILSDTFAFTQIITRMIWIS